MKLTDKKRLQILDAAEELFHSSGVEHTSMDQLALLAGVSKRTVYNHFATKDELFQAILQRMFDKLSQAGEVAFSPDQPIAGQLCAIAADEVALLSSEAFLRVAKIAMMQMMQQPELAQAMSNTAMGCKRYLEQFLHAACQAKVLQIDDVSFASQQFIYQLKAFVFYPALFGLHKPTASEQQHIISQTVAMFLARYQISAHN